MATYCSRRASKVSGRRTCELWIERQASSGMVDRGCVVGLGAGAAVGGDVASLSHRRLRCRFLNAADNWVCRRVGLMSADIRAVPGRWVIIERGPAEPA